MAIGGPNLELWRRTQRLRLHWPERRAFPRTAEAQAVGERDAAAPRPQRRAVA